MSAHESPLIGRERELRALGRALERLEGGDATFLDVAGEPGIGKTRLLDELGARAQRRGWLVLGGRATEFERDAPYGVWLDALDAHLRSLDARQLERMGGDELAALAVALPAFARVLGAPAPPTERYVVHRAMRGLLERLAMPRPLVLCLDDLHWADPASLDLVAALARRPPDRAVLLTVAYREGQVPAAIIAAARAGRAERLTPAPLTRAEAAALCGGAFTPELYALSGGNPFYLEQLARARPEVHRATPLGTPDAVAAALAGELDALPNEARRVLEAAAVVGEPFEPELVADVAELRADRTLAALDALLAPALIRPTPVPRRFVFRHPLVRHAVYAFAPAAWRLHAHARAAATLERRGAGPVERARHVEHAAQRGDRAAVDLLTAAAEAVAGQAPATAARFLESALRLLPSDAESTRVELLQTLAYARLVAGRLEPAHAALAETLELIPRDAWERRAPLIATQASIEAWQEGEVAEPLRRLRAAIADLPAGPSLAGFMLRMPLAGMELDDLRLERVTAVAADALAHARSLGEPLLEHGALAMLGLGHAAAARADAARTPIDRASAFVASADDVEIAPFPQFFCDLAWALGYLDRHEEAVGHLRREVTLSHRMGESYFIPVLLALQVAPLVQLGRLGEAIAVGEEALDAAWTVGHSPGLRLGAHADLALARHVSGDTDGALREARKAVDLAAAQARLWRGKARSTLGVILAESRPEEGIATILAAGGGLELDEVVPAARPPVWAALVEAELQRDDVAAAERVASRLEHTDTGRPLARTLAARSRAAVLLASHRTDEAAVAAERGVAAAGALPLEAARARVLRGVALARSGDRDHGIAVLEQARDELERFGAHRLREHAARELRRLGVRTWRRGPTAPRDGGLHALSPRESEVAALVLAGKRNADIAHELVLSLKTIESHTRNIYAKLGVTSRVELVTRLRDASDRG